MKRIYSIGLAAILAAGCGAAGGDDDGSDKDKDGDNGDGGTGEVGSLALADFSISDSIDPPIPSQIDTDDSSSSLALTQGASLEQCLLRDAVSQMKMNVSQVKSQLCMFENTPGIEWGGKYNISFEDAGGPGGGGPDGPGGGGPGEPEMPLTQDDPTVSPDGEDSFADGGEDSFADGGEDSFADGGEDSFADAGGEDSFADAGGEDGAGPDGGDFDFSFPESLQVFMDDTAEGVYTVWVCEDKKLTQKFTITGAKKGEGAKGSFITTFSIGGDDSIIAGNFDNGISTEGRYLGDVRMRFAFGGSQANNYVKMNLGLAEDDIHFVRSGNEFADTLFGSEDISTKELIAGRIGPDYGMAVVQRSGGNDFIFGLTEGGPETSRAYFDADGKVVDADATEDFAEGGELFVTKEEMPRLLPEFKADFGDSPWDCEGTEDFDFSAVEGGEASDPSQCFDDVSFGGEGLGCFGGDFAPGIQEEGFDDFTGERYDEGYEGGEFDDYPDEFVPPGPDGGDEPPPADGDDLEGGDELGPPEEA